MILPLTLGVEEGVNHWCVSLKRRSSLLTWMPPESSTPFGSHSWRIMSMLAIRLGLVVGTPGAMKLFPMIPDWVLR